MPPQKTPAQSSPAAQKKKNPAFSFLSILIGLPAIYFFAFTYVGVLHTRGFVFGNRIGIFQLPDLSAWIQNSFGIEKSAVPLAAVGIYAALAYLISYYPFVFAQSLMVGYDNDEPRRFREQVLKTNAFLHRMYSTHVNSMEVFPLFAASVFMARSTIVIGNETSMAVPLQVQISLTLLFLVFRVIYIPLYYFNLSNLRSLVYMCALLNCFTLMAYAVVGATEFEAWYRPLINSISQKMSMTISQLGVF